MISKQQQQFEIRRQEHYWVISYTAMASPCEILACCENASEAEELASLAYSETARIEQKFSRYRNDNIVHAINHSNGKEIDVDEETSQMLKYAGQCYKLSDGLFDVTSGILRKAWDFDGKEANPDDHLIKSLLRLVGWNKVEYQERSIKLLPGMQIDFGGIGKEYAVDKVARMLFEDSCKSLMVNFGGDIRAISSNSKQGPWRIGVEDPEGIETSLGMVELTNGAVATSGDSRRFCYVNGVRLGHILDPRTGWPVADAPRSVTVLADYCTEAGLLSTVAMLQGSEAEVFLEAQGVKYHCIR